MKGMDYETRRRISDLADDLLDAGTDPPSAVLDELRRLIGFDDETVERAAKAYYDATFDTDQGEGAEYGPYDEPWERAPTSYKKDVRAKMEIVLRAALSATEGPQDG